MGVVFSLPSSAHLPMATFFFKDFGKDASDILLKDRPTNEQIKVNGNYRGVKLAFTGKTTSGNKASASFEPSWSVADYGLDVKATLNSNGNHSVNASCNNKIASGLKLDGTFTAGKNKQLDAAVDYKWQDKATFSSKVSFMSQTTGVNLQLAAVGFRNNWAFGLQATDTVNEDFTVVADKITGAVQYNGAAFKTTVAVSQVRDILLGEFKYYRSTLNGNAVGTELTYNHTLGTAGAALGVSTVLDDGATGKVTLGSNGIVGLSYKKRLDSATQITVGCSADARSQQYNLGFNLDVDL